MLANPEEMHATFFPSFINLLLSKHFFLFFFSVYPNSFIIITFFFFVINHPSVVSRISS